MSQDNLNNITSVPQIVEPLICQWCGRGNPIANHPYHRREKKDRHFWLEDPVFYSVKARCAPYRSVNNGLSMLMYKLDKYEMASNKNKIIHDIPVRDIDHEISELQQ